MATHQKPNRYNQYNPHLEIHQLQNKNSGENMAGNVDEQHFAHL